MITPRMLLKSWAMPPASWPTLSSRRARSSCSCRAFSRSLSARSLMSRTAAAAIVSPSSSMLERLISTGNSVPSLRTANNSMPTPIDRVRGSAK